MKYKSLYYPESRLSGFSNVDGTIAFYNQVNALVDPDGVLVDIGCGRGAYGDDPVLYRRKLRIMQGKAARVIGLDVDPRAASNPYLDEFRLIDQPRWPVEDASASLCLADNVLEHIPDPSSFFSECWRILRPGGVVCIRTPNLFSYFGLISRWVPNRSHVKILRRSKERVIEEDVFPTLYRCNTLPAISRALKQQGFQPVVYSFDAEPSYLSFSRLAYYLGVLHQRYAPGMFKVGLHAFGIKPENV